MIEAIVIVSVLIGFVFGRLAAAADVVMWRNMAITYCEEYMAAKGHKGWKWPLQ